MDLLLQSRIQAVDEWLDSTRFFSPAKTMCHEIENKMHVYHILRSGRLGIHTHRARPSNSQCGLVHWNMKRLITVYILRKRSHYYNGQWKLHHNNTCMHIAQRVQISSPHMVWKWFIIFPTAQTSHPVIFSCRKETPQGPPFWISTGNVRSCRNYFQTFDVKRILTHIWWTAMALLEMCST